PFPIALGRPAASVAAPSLNCRTGATAGRKSSTSDRPCDRLLAEVITSRHAIYLPANGRMLPVFVRDTLVTRSVSPECRAPNRPSSAAYLPRASSGDRMKLLVALIAVYLSTAPAFAHDHNYPELKGWFEGLQSGRGICCDGEDALHLSDVDWERQNKEG